MSCIRWLGRLCLFIALAADALADATRHRDPFIDVRAYGARGDGVSDDTRSLNEALRAAARDVGEVVVPAGTYVISEPLEIYGGTILRGAGRGATRIVSAAGGAGFSMLRVATPNRCREGSGRCDAPIGDAARGAGCVCYSGTDCASGTCGGGAVQRDLRISDLELVVRDDDVVALDAALVGESTFSNLRIRADRDDLMRSIGVLFSDGGLDSTVSGYSNVLAFSRISGLPLCAWVMDRANDQTFLRVGFGNECGTGLLIEKHVNGTKVTNCMFQSTREPRCTSGACVGGMSHGAPCAAASDCIEADLVDLGRNTTVLASYFEDSRNPHIRLGTVQPSRASQQPLVIGNSHSGRAPYIVEANAQRPVIVETTYLTGRERTTLGGNPFVLPSLAHARLDAQPDGALVHCADCRKSHPCAPGGTGALAKRLNGQWVCD
ncbi:MAG: glycosyl hydrolase family 28-related protein [Thermodesulfobacteriota bacterium]